MSDVDATIDPIMNPLDNANPVVTEEVADNFYSPDTVEDGDWEHANMAQMQALATQGFQLPDAGLPGSFPHYRADDDYRDTTFAPPLTLRETPVESDYDPHPFDDASLHRFFTQYRGDKNEVGGPAYIVTLSQLLSFTSTPSTVNARQLFTGAGVLYGYTGLTGASTTTFEALVDGVNGDSSGRVLAVRSTFSPINAYVPVGGVSGIAFEQGLVHANILGNATVLIPIIKRLTQN